MPHASLPTGVSIVPAVVEDVPVILDLIKELAEFEKLTYMVVATEAMLAEALFAPHPKAEVVLARLDDKVVGFALFFPNFSTFLGRPGLYLEDLYVRPEARSRGIGQALLLHLAGIARERGCGRFEWTVLNWNEQAIRFYQRLGAQAMADWTIMRVSGEALQNMRKP